MPSLVVPLVVRASRLARKETAVVAEDPHLHQAAAWAHLCAAGPIPASSGKTILILSPTAYRQMIELRRSVRRYLSEPPASELLDQLQHDIWMRKGQLRTAMRADLGLLFDEDQAAD